jgi:hypothetical protein
MNSMWPKRAITCCVLTVLTVLTTAAVILAVAPAAATPANFDSSGVGGYLNYRFD